MSKFRRGLVLRGMLDFLVEAAMPIPAGTVLDEVERRVELTEWELSTNNSKEVRFHTFLRFASGWMNSIGSDLRK